MTPGTCATILPDPTQPPSFPNNWPAETFYWNATAKLTTGGGGKATLVLATEAAFLNGVIAGQGTLFSRIRITITGGLVPGAPYTVTEPYGVETLTADGAGAIKFTEDAGCTAAPCPGNVPIGGRMGPWLTWDPAVAPAPPAGYIGNFAVTHAITGSPLGTNVFRIDGPNAGGPGVNTVQTNLFNLQGQIEGPIVTASPAAGTYGTAQSVTLTASDPTAPAGSAPPSIYYTTDGSDPVVPAAGAKPTAPTKLYTGPIALPSTAGAVTTTTVKFVGVGAAGGVSAIQTQTYSIDLQLPTVSITAQPPTLSNSAKPSFTFASNKVGVTYQCGLDAAALAACTSPKSYTGLADGSHTFTVQATDAFGRVSARASASFTLDTVPPAVSITGQPTNPTNNANPSFTFAATKAGTTFQCALDGGALAACTSPQAYTALADGTHTFKVQATDTVGNSSSASYAFTIDRVAPVVSITGQPAALSNNANPSFTFAATKAGTAFQCALDGAALAPCTSPQSYTALANGAHTLTVQGTDPAGNSSAASSAFTIDTVAPSVPTGLTARATGVSAITLSWTATTDTAGVARYQVFRDGGTTPIGIVTTGTTFADTRLAASSTHSYTVVAVDGAGNASARSVATSATTLTPVAPLKVTVRVPRGIISHGTPVVVSVHTRPNADAVITLRLTRQGTRCTTVAHHRVCRPVTVVLAQRVVHVRANRQGLVSRSVALGYSPASAARATLGVHVSTRYGAASYAAAVRLQAAPRSR